MAGFENYQEATRKIEDEIEQRHALTERLR